MTPVLVDNDIETNVLKNWRIDCGWKRIIIVKENGIFWDS